MRHRKSTAWLLMAPALIVVGLLLFYPSVNTVMMSFFRVPRLTAPISEWQFAGLGNYVDLFSIRLYRQSLINIALLWLLAGTLTIALALLLATALTSGIRFARIFTIIIYLPEVISALALGYVWLLFVYNPRFGLFQWAAKTFLLDWIAAIRWTAPDTIFFAMMLAGVFAATGYFTLMYISALKKVPASLHEAARIEGANGLQRFVTITLPLISNETKSIILIFSMATINYFAFPLIFSGSGTITPMLFTYNAIFGSELDVKTNVGLGAASTVTLLLAAVVIFVLNRQAIRNAKHYF